MTAGAILDVIQHAAVQELLAKCHPLGMFDAIATLAVASNMRELYRLVLVRLPGPACWFTALKSSAYTTASTACNHTGDVAFLCRSLANTSNWAPSRVASGAINSAANGRRWTRHWRPTLQRR